MPVTQQETKLVTIAAGASLSGAAVLEGASVVGVVTDAAWDAAAVSFAVSVDGTTYVPLRYQGVEFSEAAPGASQYVALNPSVFAGVQYVKVRSGTSGAAVNQADATVVTLICRPV